MAGVTLYDYQLDAINRMKIGCILCGGVGSGKSRTSLAFYYRLYAIAGLLASFGCDRQAGCVLYIQHKIAKAMEADERKCRNEKHV